MHRFKNILVGVDLSAGDRLVGDSLAAPSERAVDQALWLARLNNADLTFLYSLDVCPQTQCILKEEPIGRTIAREARAALNTLVQRAKSIGINARCDVTMGHSWRELIMQVLKYQHDLVVVGTCHRSTLSRIMFGSTGMKLLRKCPCPVWITKPSEINENGSVLVSHDLSPVSTLALELGASLSELQNADLHVLHVVDRSRYSDLTAVDAVFSLLADQKSLAKHQISSELQELKSTRTPRIAIEDGDAAELVLKYIEENGIGLIAMGTIGRSGISGMITGNTAERLLPRIPCSVLAVKPTDFVSPVCLDS